MKISKNEAEHYIWGGSCDGWWLVKEETRGILQERMPPGTSEVRHYHERAAQFFFVLSGTLTMEHKGETIVLHPQEGLSVLPMEPHQARNESDHDVEFLVISQPTSSGDRVLV